MHRLALLAAGALCAVAAPAAAKTYTGTRTVPTSSIFGNGASTLNLSITTDGTFGALAASNITGWTIIVSGSLDSRDDFTFNPVTSGLSLFGDALVATDTTLTFDFDSPSSDIFQVAQNPGAPDGLQHFYCLQTGYACANQTNVTASAELLYTAANRQEFSSNTRSGPMTLATSPASAGAVPEPATWAIMIMGFGLAGASLRRRGAKPALA